MSETTEDKKSGTFEQSHPSVPVVYADAAANLHISPAGVAKIYFYRADPDINAEETAKDVPAFQLVLPVTGLANSLNFLRESLLQMDPPEVREEVKVRLRAAKDK